MTYRVYIKKDYKPEVKWVKERKNRSGSLSFITLGLLAAVSVFYYFSDRPDTTTPNVVAERSGPAFTPVVRHEAKVIPAVVTEKTPEEQTLHQEPTALPVAYYQPSLPPTLTEEAEQKIEVLAEENRVIDTIAVEAEPEAGPDPDWQTVTVKNGDSMALIFSRLGLSPAELYRVMSLGNDVKRLKSIKPGQLIHFHIVDKKLVGLEYELDLTNTLSVNLVDNNFKATLVEHELDSVVKNASATINDSLFMAGKRAGMSDNLIMQMVAIYGWDIDFVLDIRKGDSFTLIYEEKYKNGKKVADGPILAAEFNNRGHAIRAVRYAHLDGSIDYYDANGDAMRKAFLRTPVNFTRISSRFDLSRKHPILNKIRAHKGVDYAAPTGTPIKATGDGVVMHAGRKGGYGKTIILRHGGNYSTVYAHLHKYANGVRNGRRVKQGQIIGYVGSSGLATGPHLHYEFRINGVHRNPLTVDLPHVESISKKELPVFQQAITPMLAELDRITGKTVLASQPPLLSDNTISPVMKEGG
ncbi:MAG: peptidoglycan DD-metalloendopeptidase family protein [Gammaproteobacteria bacterium]